MQPVGGRGEGREGLVIPICWFTGLPSLSPEGGAAEQNYLYSCWRLWRGSLRISSAPSGVAPPSPGSLWREQIIMNCASVL